MQEYKLYVGNLSYTTTEEQLRELFSQYGEIKEAVVVKDRMSGRSKGFGFVEFSASEELDRAIEGQNNKEFMGRAIRVNKAYSKSDRPGRGRAGNRSREF